MPYIQLGLHIIEDERGFGLKKISIDINTTNLPSDSILIGMIARALISGLSENKEDVKIQDLLNELDISLSA